MRLSLFVNQTETPDSKPVWLNQSVNVLVKINDINLKIHAKIRIVNVVLSFCIGKVNVLKC